jgi:transposase
MKQYRSWTPEQAYLLPPSPLDWLPEGHLAYFVLELVREVDLTAIESAVQSGDSRGTRPYAPKMMTALLVYAYCVGIFSSRRIERATYEDVAFRVLSGGEHPHFTTVNEFRLVHRKALASLFLKVLQLCRRAGLVSLGHVSLDGSKVQANASKHKAMSYARMKEEEKRLSAEIEAMLFRADEVDVQEDERWGRGQSAEQLPEELQRRDERLKRIRAAKAELENEAKQARAEELRDHAKVQSERADTTLDEVERKRCATRAQKAEDEARSLSRDDDDGPPSAGCDATNDLPHHRVPTTANGEPTSKAQRNFTDADSRIMVKGGAFIQAFNAHVVVDEAHQIILAEAVTNQPPDCEHLVPMVDRVVANCGEAPKTMTADSGYFSAQNVEHCAHSGIDVYIALRKTDVAKLGRLPATPAQDARQDMHDKLTTDRGRSTYARRKATVEPVFGQIKEARCFRRFSLRGLDKVRSEWSLVCLCHNVLKLFRAVGSLGRLPAVQAA